MRSNFENFFAGLESAKFASERYAAEVGIDTLGGKRSDLLNEEHGAKQQ